jgi:hypothetical protein
MALRTVPLDPTTKRPTTLRHQVYTGSRQRPIIFNRRTPPVPLCIRDLLCFPLQDHERKWKFDVKNDIGFYVGDEDSTKGGSLIYIPYTHKVLTRGGGHHILISDVQLLQWYARRRDITRNPLPYSTTVKDAVMDLTANRDTTVIMSDKTQLLITPRQKITIH